MRVCFVVVRLGFFSTSLSDWLGRTFPELRISMLRWMRYLNSRRCHYMICVLLFIMGCVCYLCYAVCFCRLCLLFSRIYSKSCDCKIVGLGGSIQIKQFTSFFSRACHTARRDLSSHVSVRLSQKMSEAQSTPPPPQFTHRVRVRPRRTKKSSVRGGSKIDICWPDMTAKFQI